MSKKDFRSILQPYADYLEQMHRCIQRHVQEMSDEEVRALRRAALEPSAANCSWAIFEAAAAVRERTDRELFRRKGKIDP